MVGHRVQPAHPDRPAVRDAKALDALDGRRRGYDLPAAGSHGPRLLRTGGVHRKNADPGASVHESAHYVLIIRKRNRSDAIQVVHRKRRN